MESSKKSKRLQQSWLILLLLLSGLLMLLRSFLSRQAGQMISETLTTRNRVRNDTITLLNVDKKAYIRAVRELLGTDEEHAKYVTAVAMHETGVFTSSVYINNRNAYGMRYPSKRTHMAIGQKNGYAVYNSVEDSITDYGLWLAYHGKTINDFESPEALVDFMASKGYFEADKAKYKAAVRNHYNSL